MNRRLLLLGHASWAYVMGRRVGDRLGVRPNLYLLLLLGILPDIDLLLGALGLQHRTITHSVIFWSLVFVPVFAKYRVMATPYFVAVTQHIVFGDLLVGKTSIFWPLIDPKLGLGIHILSPVNLALEAAGFVVFCIVAARNGDLSSYKLTPLAAMVIIPFVGFVVLAPASDWLLPIIVEGSEVPNLQRSVSAILNNPSFYVALILHVAMVAVLLRSLLRTSGSTRIRSEATSKAD